MKEKLEQLAFKFFEGKKVDKVCGIILKLAFLYFGFQLIRIII